MTFFINRIFLILVLLFTIYACACAQTSSSTTDANITINQVIHRLEQFYAHEFPPDTVFSPTPLGSFKEEDLLRRYRFYCDQRDTLKKIDSANLPIYDFINLELLRYLIQDQLNYYEFREYMNPILSDNGFHTGLAYETGMQFSALSEFNRYINKLRAFPIYSRQQMELIRQGLKLGISQPTIALTGYESTYNSHITDTVENSLFFKPFRTKPAPMEQAVWDSLLSEGKHAIMQNVIPEFRKIKAFFEKEYFPKARKTLGASELPDGKKYYAAIVKHYTTTDLTPEEVFNIGMNEVTRIKSEMLTIITDVGFKGTFADFLQYLRTEPRFYATTPEQLLKEASFISKKIDGKLPLLFGKLPRQPYGVAPVPAHLAPTYTTGRYSGAPISSKNAGEYWVNTYNLPSRTLYTLEALTLHEAVPGHHLQIALAQELDNLPKFRRSYYVNSFGEGWGLYSEFLGTELGLYKDPYSRFGYLTYEMWRACRLVIDAGIHSKGWTREQAVDFLASNSALSMHEVNTEINRYITWPGQALAYKIGELKIIELRRKAEKELGDKFDIRAFHDLVLSQGSVTLMILERMVNDWIIAVKNK